MSSLSIYIFDLDGTIANIDHRRHLVEGVNKDWNSFYKRCCDDIINKEVSTIWDCLSHDENNKLYIFSGRSDIVRDETETWLYLNGIHPERLIMRSEGDYTPDDELKKKWLYEFIDIEGIKKENIKIVFDDRNKVVKMWRDNDLTCFQCYDGDF